MKNVTLKLIIIVRVKQNIELCDKCGKEFSTNQFNKHYVDCLGIEDKEKKRKKYNKTRSESITAFRRRRKILLVEYKGGKCQKCGYNKSMWALEFHHLDPTKKDFNISGSNCKSLEIEKQEVDKCILVCSNCHSEIHENLYYAT